MIGTMPTKPKKQPKGSWAARLQALRARLNLPIEQFAERIGVSVHTCTAWLYGTRIPGGPSQRLIEIIEKQ